MPFHFITPEYPPDVGGVAHYTRLVGAQLARFGEDVHVWCPGAAPGRREAGVEIHPVAGCFSLAGLRRLDRRLAAFPGPRRLLVQWVPHGYGWRSVNIPFCAWLWLRRHLHHDCVEIVFHEVCLPFKPRAWKQNAAAAAHRAMLAVLLRAASRVWMATPAWEPMLRRYLRGSGVPVLWLPVPSNIPVSSGSARDIRRRYAGDGQALIGSFGTHGQPVAGMMTTVAAHLARAYPDLRLVLIGAGSRMLAAEIERRAGVPHGRVYATGPLDEAAVSLHIQACDVMIQPYPDGVNTRRGSMMAALAHGKAIVTTTGPQTEPFWGEEGAALALSCDDLPALADAAAALAHDGARRRALGHAAGSLFQRRFAVERIAAMLLDASGAARPAQEVPCAF